MGDDKKTLMVDIVDIAIVAIPQLIKLVTAIIETIKDSELNDKQRDELIQKIKDMQVAVLTLPDIE